jgi:osmotically-inducible protein OsmY
MPRFRTAGLMLALLALAGCGPRDLLLGTGVAAGTASLQERGMSGAMSDYNLRLLINDAWFKNSLELYQHASLMISKGRIVIIGRVPTEAMRLQAERLAHAAAKTAIINRLQVGDALTLGQSLQDKSITTQIQAKLTFDRDVNALNFDVATVNGIVYVVGEAESEREERRIRYLASSVGGVKAIESHIHVPEFNVP